MKLLVDLHVELAAVAHMQAELLLFLVHNRACITELLRIPLLEDGTLEFTAVTFGRSGLGRTVARPHTTRGRRVKLLSCADFFGFLHLLLIILNLIKVLDSSGSVLLGLLGSLSLGRVGHGSWEIKTRGDGSFLL